MLKSETDDLVRALATKPLNGKRMFTEYLLYRMSKILGGKTARLLPLYSNPASPLVNVIGATEAQSLDTSVASPDPDNYVPLVEAEITDFLVDHADEARYVIAVIKPTKSGEKLPIFSLPLSVKREMLFVEAERLTWLTKQLETGTKLFVHQTHPRVMIDGKSQDIEKLFADLDRDYFSVLQDVDKLRRIALVEVDDLCYYGAKDNELDWTYHDRAVRVQSVSANNDEATVVALLTDEIYQNVPTADLLTEAQFSFYIPRPFCPLIQSWISTAEISEGV